MVTSFPVNYDWVNVEDVRAAAKRDPPLSEPSAHKDIALTNLKVLKGANGKNQLEGIAPILAMALEVLAVTSVAVAIAIVLLGSGAGKATQPGPAAAGQCQCANGDSGAAKGTVSRRASVAHAGRARSLARG